MMFTMGGGAGDSDLTQVTDHVDTSSSDDRVSRFLYDFRDSVVAEKDGIQTTETDGAHRPITYYVLDNQGEAVRSYLYDGDGVALTDFSTAAIRGPPDGGRHGCSCARRGQLRRRGAYLSQPAVQHRPEQRDQWIE
jgi:hypothetical protein